MAQNRRQMFSDDRFVVNAEILNDALKLLKSDGSIVTFSGGGGVSQVQVDWNITDTSSVSFIKNKPTNLSQFTNDSGFITSSYHDNTKQNVINASNKLPYSYLSGTPELGTASEKDYTTSITNGGVDLPTSGSVYSYADLYTRITASRDWLEEIVSGFTFPTIYGGVAYKVTAGNLRSFIVNGLSIPTKTSDLTNDSGFIYESYLDNYLAKPNISTTGLYALNYTGATMNGWSRITIPSSPGNLNTDNSTGFTVNQNEPLSGNVSLHKISKTGSYNDLMDKPTIPSAQVQTDWNATSGMGVLLNKPTSLPASDVYSWAKASSKPSYQFYEISNRYEQLQQWGGSALKSNMSPIDAACMFGFNRLAFLNPNAITVEYSTNGGSSWSTYSSASNEVKTKLTTTFDVSLFTGATSSASASNYRLRVTIRGYGYFYYITKKFLISVSTNGCESCKCKITKTTYGSQSTWVNVGEYDIGGWSGWNSIPVTDMYWGSTQTNNAYDVRFEFYYGSKSSSYPNAQLSVRGISLIAPTEWSKASDMASTGHIYTYDYNKNVTFPSNVNVQNNLTLVGSTSGTPNIVFQRGTTSDGYTDWRIMDESGSLKFQYKSTGSSWNTACTMGEQAFVTAYNPFLSWGATTTVAKIGGVDIKVSMPSNPLCLAEGTEISMWDGSVKNIEDIEIGDEVVGFNPITKENIKSVVLDARREGSTFDQLHEVTFDDGSCLITAQGHDVYNVEEERPINIDRWHDGMKARHINGNSIELFANVGDMPTPESIPYYNIDTDCATYYANGILCGSNEKQVIQSLYKNYHEKIGDNSDMQKLVDMANKLYSQNMFKVRNTPEIKAFRIKIIESFRKGTQAISVVNDCQRQLDELDKKEHKTFRRGLTDDELAEIERKKNELVSLLKAKQKEADYWREIEHKLREEVEVTMGCRNEKERYNKIFSIMQDNIETLHAFSRKIKLYKDTTK